MKKLFLNVMAIMLLLVVFCPLSVKAATLTTDLENGEMQVGERVKVTITTNESLESLEFDLKFDNTKYKFIEPTNQNLADDEVDSAMAHLLPSDSSVVRVSAVDTTGNKKLKDVVLEFEAIKGGTAVPFSIFNYEFGEQGRANATETAIAENLKVVVAKIDGKDTPSNNGQPQPVNDAGQVITQLPQTSAIVSDGMYTKVGNLQAGNLEFIVPYRLPNPKEPFTSEHIKSEYLYAENISSIRTGSTFTMFNNTYKVLIYGDVNQDGKITTSDALVIYRGATNLSDIQNEAADVNHDGRVDKEDAKLIQKFILEVVLFEAPEGNEYVKLDVIEGLTSQSDNKTILESTTVTAVGTFKSTNDIAVTSSNIKKINMDVKVNGTQLTNNEKEDILEISSPDSNGNVIISIKPTKPGNYVITPVITGANVKGGEVRSQTTITCVVEADITVSELKIEYNGTPIYTGTQTIEIPIMKDNASQCRVLDVKLYNANGNDITDKISANNVNVTYTGSVLAAPTGISEASGKKTLLLAITMDPTIEEDDTGTITISIGSFSKTINTIAIELERDALILNGTQYTGTAGTGNIVLYSGYVAGSNQPANTVVGNDGLLYTKINIAQRDSDGDIVQAWTSRTGSTNAFNDDYGNVWFQLDNNKLSFKAFCKDTTGAIVEAGATDAGRIEFVGIAIKAGVTDTAFTIPVSMNSQTIKVTLTAAVNSVAPIAASVVSEQPKAEIAKQPAVEQPKVEKAPENNKVNYTIEYYYDGELDSSKTEIVESTVGTEITASTIKSKVDTNITDGYKVDETKAFTTLVLDKDASTNVIKVYYVKDEQKPIEETIGKEQQNDKKVDEPKPSEQKPADSKPAEEVLDAEPQPEETTEEGKVVTEVPAEVDKK